MRAALAALAAVLVLAPGCRECSCGGTSAAIDVLLTEADNSTVVAVGTDQLIGVQLDGSGRTVTSSDPSRLGTSGNVPQPSSKTVALFRSAWKQTSAGLYEYGGTVTLSAPARGTAPAWSVTLIVATYALRLSPINVVTLGESWVYRWALGGQPPASSNETVLAPFAYPTLVTAASADFAVAGITTSGGFNQQIYYAAAPGQGFLHDPLPFPLATNEQGGMVNQFIVKANPDWSCSVASGCRKTNANGPPRPDEGYGYGSTPPAIASTGH